MGRAQFLVADLCVHDTKIDIIMSSVLKFEDIWLQGYDAITILDYGFAFYSPRIWQHAMLDYANGHPIKIQSRNAIWGRWQHKFVEDRVGDLGKL